MNSNAQRVESWLLAIENARNHGGLHTLGDEYHKLFRPDASLFVPGEMIISGRWVGFDGWREMATLAYATLAEGAVSRLEQIVANDAVCAAIIHYSWARGDVRCDTRATELRWFGDDGLVYEGEFMASDWAAVSAVFSS